MTSPDAATLALIAILGTVATGLFGVIGTLFKLLNDNTAATSALVEETKKGNREAKERNGHLGEQNIQIAKIVQSQSVDIAEIKDTSKLSADTQKRVEQILLASAETLVQTEVNKVKAVTSVKDDLRKG